MWYKIITYINVENEDVARNIKSDVCSAVLARSNIDVLIYGEKTEEFEVNEQSRILQGQGSSM